MYSHMRQDCSESARERRIALYKNDQQQHKQQQQQQQLKQGVTRHRICKLSRKSSANDIHRPRGREKVKEQGQTGFNPFTVPACIFSRLEKTKTKTTTLNKEKTKKKEGTGPRKENVSGLHLTSLQLLSVLCISVSVPVRDTG